MGKADVKCCDYSFCRFATITRTAIVSVDGHLHFVINLGMEAVWTVGPCLKKVGVIFMSLLAIKDICTKTGYLGQRN